MRARGFFNNFLCPSYRPLSLPACAPVSDPSVDAASRRCSVCRRSWRGRLGKKSCRQRFDWAGCFTFSSIFRQISLIYYIHPWVVMATTIKSDFCLGRTKQQLQKVRSMCPSVTTLVWRAAMLLLLPMPLAVGSLLPRQQPQQHQQS